MTHKYVAYFTKGLADVAMSELHTLVPSLTVTEQTERFAIVGMSWSQAQRVQQDSRTLDDLRLLVGGPATIEGETEFAALCRQAAAAAAAFLVHHDPDRARETTWSVTLSARNPVWRAHKDWEPAPAVEKELHGASLDATTRSLVDLRLQVEGERMHLALNLGVQPLGKRDMAARPGALRPTVAAAMVRLVLDAASPDRKGGILYDPFCGSGSIALEAARLGLKVFASDIDPEAVDITRQRLRSIARPAGPGADDELAHRVFVHDMLKGIPKRVKAPLIAANLPWGKQVKLDRRSDLYRAVALLAAEAIELGGSCVFLTTHEGQLAAQLRKASKNLTVTTQRIGLLGQTPALVIVKRH